MNPVYTPFTLGLVNPKYAISTFGLVSGFLIFIWMTFIFYNIILSFLSATIFYIIYSIILFLKKNNFRIAYSIYEFGHIEVYDQNIMVFLFIFLFLLFRF